MLFIVLFVTNLEGYQWVPSGSRIGLPRNAVYAGRFYDKYPVYVGRWINFSEIRSLCSIFKSRKFFISADLNIHKMAGHPLLLKLRAKFTVTMPFKEKSIVPIILMFSLLLMMNSSGFLQQTVVHVQMTFWVTAYSKSVDFLTIQPQLSWVKFIIIAECIILATVKRASRITTIVCAKIFNFKSLEK